MRCSCRRFTGLLLMLLCLTGSTAVRAEIPKVPGLTVIVVIVESLMPRELAASDLRFPTLHELRIDGTWYTESRGVFPSNDLNGHASLLTGRYPESHGIANNVTWSRKRREIPRAPSRPSDLAAPTLFRMLHKHCPELQTAVVIADREVQELYSDCGSSGAHCSPFARAPSRLYQPANDPAFNAALGHVPDARAVEIARQYLPHASLLLLSLSDLDTIGHLATADPVTGTSGQRLATLGHLDEQLGLLVADLKQSGRWSSTVLMITSSHGMEWSTPEQTLALAPMLETLHPGVFLPVGSGGFQSYYLRRPQDPAAWMAARDSLALLRAQIGIAGAWFTSLHSAAVDGLTSTEQVDLLVPGGLHARSAGLGDLVVATLPGYQIAGAQQSAVGSGGHHGSLTTMHISMLISGGAHFLQRRLVTAPGAFMDENGAADPALRLPGQAEIVDIAPTITWLLGLPATTGGTTDAAKGAPSTGSRAVHQGRALKEAFLLKGDQPLGTCGQR